METEVAEKTAEAEPAISPSPRSKTVALNKPLIITALILATALSALDGTVVATALPTIVGVLGGLPLYSLVVSAYLLTSTTTVPIYGKLADMYGRKPGSWWDRAYSYWARLYADWRGICLLLLASGRYRA